MIGECFVNKKFQRLFIGNMRLGGGNGRANHFVYLQIVRDRTKPLWNLDFMKKYKHPLPNRALRRVFGMKTSNEQVSIDVESDDVDAGGTSIEVEGKSTKNLEYFVEGGTNAKISMADANRSTSVLVETRSAVKGVVAADNDITVAISDPSRNMQQVVKVSDRCTVARWMVEQENLNVMGIPSKAMKQFPMLFRAPNENANIQKATRWFKKRHDLLKPGIARCISFNHHAGSRKKCSLKTAGGRGRPRLKWVDWLHVNLLDEFERLSSAGVKFSNDILRQIARDILLNSTHEVFHPNYVDPKDKKQQRIIEKVTYGWITAFVNKQES